MSEGLNHPLKDILVSKFGPLPELVSPRFENFTYQLIQYNDVDNHLVLQELRSGYGSTAFIDYVLMEGETPIKARRERGFHNRTRLEPGELFLHDIKAEFEIGNIRTEYRLDYRKEQDAPNEPENYYPIRPNIYMYFVMGNSRLNPLLSHISFMGDKPNSIVISLYDSFDQVREYKEGAEKEDPSQKGSVVYESFNPHQVGFMINMSGMESYGEILMHTNLTGRLESMSWGVPLDLSDASYAYNAAREGGTMCFQRVDKQAGKIDELIIPDQINLDEFGRKMRGKLADWTGVPSLYPLELKRTIIG